jgi:hypothetical protein
LASFREQEWDSTENENSFSSRNKGISETDFKGKDKLIMSSSSLTTRESLDAENEETHKGFAAYQL